MIDKEKVIKGWECHMESDTLRCADCPYRDGWRTCNYADTLYKDVYALLKEQEEKMEHLNNITLEYEKEVFRLQAMLKEQEAKTGHWIDTTNTIGFPRCECSECNSEAGAIWMKYCPNCGAKMEGR